MKTYKILVEEKKLIEYDVAASTRDEAKKLFNEGLLEDLEFRIVDVLYERILNVDETL